MRIWIVSYTLEELIESLLSRALPGLERRRKAPKARSIVQGLEALMEVRS
jgi:hypothetical protein